MGERQAQNHFSGDCFTVLDVLSTKVTQSGIAQSGGAYLTDNGYPTSSLFTAQLDPYAFENGDRDLRGNHFACQHRSRPTDRLISDDFILAGESVDLLRREAELPIDVINHLDLHIPGGAKAALVGESGAGKSTIVSLLGRFYERDGGSITVDGTDIDSVTQKSLHESIGFVQQNVFLFDATIRENLRYGKADADDEEMWQALRDANLASFVASLPDGLDTEVGERGTRLSGGQKQRLSIARIFLKNPRILVFDEATSSLDTESEKQIQEALDRLSKGRTSIVIAHRLSTIQDSDIIFVIDKGSVRERGTHQELLEKHGLYYRLYSLKD